MTFNPNIPATGTKISKTFQLIQQNFTQLNQLYGAASGRDHVEWNNAEVSDRGLHKKVQMVEVSPDPTLSAPQSQIYTKAKAVPGDTLSKLFYAQKPTTAIQEVLEMTYLTATAVSGAGSSQAWSGRAYDTPWGWRIHFGAFAAGFSGVNSITGLTVPLLGQLLYSGEGPFGTPSAISIDIVSSTAFNSNHSVNTNSNVIIITSGNSGL